MITEISRDPRISLSLGSNDPHRIAQNIIDMITEQLNQRAPKKRIQCANKKSNISPRTQELIDLRTTAWTQYNVDPSQDNLRGYRRLKSQVKKSFISNKCDHDKRKVSEAATSKDLWKQAKQVIGWTAYGGPRTLVSEGHPITSPREMARVLNMDYITRTAKAARDTAPL